MQGLSAHRHYKAILDVAKEAAVASIFSDIGCYTLGCLPPYEAINSCVDMGASITMAHGASRRAAPGAVRDRRLDLYAFRHDRLARAAKADANMTVFLLDNATVAMTGGQQTLAAGDDLVRVVEGLGVPKEHIKIIEPLRSITRRTWRRSRKRSSIAACR